MLPLEEKVWKLGEIIDPEWVDKMTEAGKYIGPLELTKEEADAIFNNIAT